MTKTADCKGITFKGSSGGLDSAMGFQSKKMRPRPVNKLMQLLTN